MGCGSKIEKFAILTKGLTVINRVLKALLNLLAFKYDTKDARIFGKNLTVTSLYEKSEE